MKAMSLTLTSYFPSWSLLARDDGGKPAIAINVKEKKLVPGLPDLTSREEVKITAYRVKKEYAEKLIL